MVKLGYIDNNENGRDGFGKNCKYYMNPHAMRVSKMYVLSMLEILWVISYRSTLWTVQCKRLRNSPEVAVH